MAFDYYIVTGDTRKGPYDIVMLIKKIRNGTLLTSTLIQKEEAVAAKPAVEWPELAEFFNAKKDEQTDTSKHPELRQRSLFEALQGGWNFLQRNPLSCVFAGIWVLAVIAMMGGAYFVLPEKARPIAYVVCFIFSHFLLSCYQFTVLRMIRSQPFGPAYLFGKIFPEIEALLFSSTYISVTVILGLVIFAIAGTLLKSMIGLMIVAIPGFFILTIYSLAPLLVLDQGLRLRDAMKMSRQAVMKSGIENIGVLYALLVINFIGGLLIILPMAITLPITMGALAEIYEDSF